MKSLEDETVIQIAKEIAQSNETIIREKIYSEGILFDDELDRVMTRRVQRELASAINELLGLDNRIILLEREIGSEYRAIYYSCDDYSGSKEVNEKARDHYKA